MNNQPRGSSQLRTTKGRPKPAFLIVLTIGALTTFSGCSVSSYLKQVWQPYDEMGCCAVTGVRARLQAQKMWTAKYAHCYGRLNNARDIRRGFIDGFVETANGGSGNAPIVPPEKYCGIGRKVQANCWYQGYPLGVAAAESSGASNWRQSTINPALAACFATPKCSPGCIPVPDACGCNTVGCNGNCGSVPASSMVQPPMMFDHNQPGMQHSDMQHSDMQHSGMQQTEIQDAQGQSSHSDDMGGIQQPLQSYQQETVPMAPKEPLPAPKKPDVIDDRPLQLDRDLNAPPKPSEAIERAIDAATDDVTRGRATSVSQPLADVESVFQVPSHRTPTVQQDPVQAPQFDAGSEPFQAKVAPNNPVKPSEVFDSLSDSILDRDSDSDSDSDPVVTGPIEMPNIQVSFDWMEPDWLFGEVDITRALLEQEVPSALKDQ